ncbi:MAG: hypothetical protein F4Z31_02435 [Gemmatimonadetes bacterium]|nr:hypothetical protein [Gemmatimonadota bacterium]
MVSSPSVVSLCSGIGGLEAALVGDVVATADTDPHCRAVLEARWPGVDQLDDWTTLDTLDPWGPDVVTAGLPCQPVSTAGMRRGADDKRWLFGDLAQLIVRSAARPHIFMENVPGIVDHAAAALDEFRQTLADLGYRTSTIEITAAAACGAAHKRLRWFLLAEHPDNPAPITPTPLAADARATNGRTLPTLVASDSRSSGLRPNISDRSLTDVLLRTLIASDRFGRGKNPAQGRLSDQLLPTLVAGDGSNGPGYRPDRQTQNRLPARLLGRPTSLRTLTARDANVGTSVRKPQQQRQFDFLTITKQLLAENGYGNEPIVDAEGRIVTWGKHASAIARQGAAVGRPTPEQVREPGRQRLDPAGCEWYMYQPPGAVADLVPSRHAIRILGNSVIPDHAAAALEALKAQPTLF